ncbi:hypothetical protein BDR06DRAFT_1008214 [Suillus hirtellus]|nr:hypothetical protein BDR06DRAFT_1008214 [Suillus hirtellus]
MPGQLNIFVHEGKIYTSLNTSSLPNDIPHKPVWDPWDDHDASPDDSTSPLTTCWAYAARPWFPLVPLNPSFDSPIFECLNHSMFSLYTEVNSQGKHLLHCDIREKWHKLGQKLLWCQELLGAGLLIPWGTCASTRSLSIWENQKKEEKESPSQWQSHESREWAAKNHSLPGKSSTATVFKWQPQDEFEGFLLRICLMKAEVLGTWGNYSNSTRLYNSFRNEWDLCDQLDPTSTPDGNWEEDQFNFLDPIPDPVPPPPPVPPSLSSFLQDIRTYFGRHEVAALSDYTKGIERFITHLRFHLGFHLMASSTRSIGGTSRPNGGTSSEVQNNSASTNGGAIRSNGGTTRSNAGSAAFESWVKKQKFNHVCNIVGDSGKDVDSISDMQKHVITCFVGYLVTLPTSQLSEIPADHWDLAPGTPLSALNAFIRVCYLNIPSQE